MTVNEQPTRRSRALRFLAAGTTAAIALSAVGLAAGGPAQAADLPYAQSVGRFLDGAVGGTPIQSLADVKDARAVAPGSTSQQNPLDAKLLGQLEVPLGHALQLPGGGVFRLGAVNQVAVAKDNGASYGASGAVSNSGGVSLGGGNGRFPADAKIDLSAKALGSIPIPGIPTIPGLPGLPGGSASALGGVSADIGAVSALAQTHAGGSFAMPRYQIAGLKLVLESPALAALLKQLVAGGKQLNPIINKIANRLLKILNIKLPSSCRLNLGLPPTISLDHGAVVIDPSTGSITVDLAALLRTLKLDLNKLPPNTDLLAYLLNNLGNILSKGLPAVVNGIVNPIKNLGSSCLQSLDAIPGVGTVLQTLLTNLTAGQKQLTKSLQQLSDALTKAGAPLLTQLTDNLSKVVAIGVNVQQDAFPLSFERTPQYKFDSNLAPTPDQATSPVGGQGVVRAIEIDLLGAGGAALSLGNAAAGPSTAPIPSPTPVTTLPPAPSTQVPTGVPAGDAAQGGGSSGLSLLLVLAVLGLGGLGALAVRSRGRFTR